MEQLFCMSLYIQPIFLKYYIKTLTMFKIKYHVLLPIPLVDWKLSMWTLFKNISNESVSIQLSAACLWEVKALIAFVLEIVSVMFTKKQCEGEETSPF